MRSHERGKDLGAASEAAVRLCGLASGTVACDALDDATLERVEEEFLCASGERWGGVWRGVPVAALLDRPDVEVDPEATHVQVGADGYAVCVPILTALDGVLAVEREGEPLPPARRPRFVAPVEAGRTVRGVRELRFLRLGPAEDPQDYEELGY
ncbi:molybdopterin-dependent oxidoreductase [Halorubrum kocurii]|uniref:Pterin operon protein n=1 Tax=Halorubrum kocurii JCM 14978 TaxID=1230456 RepID=M0P5W3_9EURY|nr:molybdopterin-dependent oxidoreductase [Halorubrum kocurii]EMA65223.1 pterin operon protein [Halorubrum kocurii JCM 14978]